MSGCPTACSSGLLPAAAFRRARLVLFGGNSGNLRRSRKSVRAPGKRRRRRSRDLAGRDSKGRATTAAKRKAGRCCEPSNSCFITRRQGSAVPHKNSPCRRRRSRPSAARPRPVMLHLKRWSAKRKAEKPCEVDVSTQTDDRGGQHCSTSRAAAATSPQLQPRLIARSQPLNAPNHATLTL
jgi:hypothetical protein